MKSKAILAAVVLIAVSQPLLAQSDNPNDVSLGDLARTLRQKKDAARTPAPAAPVIDNDNFDAVMADAASHRPAHGPTFSFDSLGKNFKVSSPDVTCSLSFNANATALISDPYASRDLPPEDLAKLEGPAMIDGNALEISLHNGSGWSLKEITVGLTILRREDEQAYLGPARIITAAATPLPGAPPVPEERHSDVTVLYHIRGAAAPDSTTLFRESLEMPIPPDQEWHWAIVEAKGYPPRTSPPQPEAPAEPQSGTPPQNSPSPSTQQPATNPAPSK